MSKVSPRGIGFAVQPARAGAQAVRPTDDVSSTEDASSTEPVSGRGLDVRGPQRLTAADSVIELLWTERWPVAGTTSETIRAGNGSSPPYGPAAISSGSIDPPRFGNAADRDRQLLFEGVDFFTRLGFSAQHGGPAFKAVLLEMGRSPDALSPAVRKALDAHMEREFKQAGSRGSQPIDSATATDMMIKGLHVLTG